MALQTDPQLVMLYLGYTDPRMYPYGSHITKPSTDYPSMLYQLSDYNRLLTLTGAIATTIDSTILELQGIDTAIAAARKDSMAVRVDKLEVNYVQHLAILYKEGSRLLSILSNLTAIPLVYDKYRQNSSRGSKYSIKSYS